MSVYLELVVKGVVQVVVHVEDPDDVRGCLQVLGLDQEQLHVHIMTSVVVHLF